MFPHAVASTFYSVYLQNDTCGTWTQKYKFTRYDEAIGLFEQKVFDETTVHLVRNKVIRTRLRYFTPIAMN